LAAGLSPHACAKHTRALQTPQNKPQKLRDECLRGAKYLARLLEGLGCEVRLAAHAENKNPVVMGRLGQ
jgi:hypothetical protein